jgi:hypothetical protein
VIHFGNFPKMELAVICIDTRNLDETGQSSAKGA